MKQLKPAFGYGYLTWPKQTPLDERLFGKLFHHDIHCNASRRQPMGNDGCSCFYRAGRHGDIHGDSK